MVECAVWHSPAIQTRLSQANQNQEIEVGDKNLWVSQIMCSHSESDSNCLHFDMEWLQNPTQFCATVDGFYCSKQWHLDATVGQAVVGFWSHPNVIFHREKKMKSLGGSFSGKEITHNNIYIIGKLAWLSGNKQFSSWECGSFVFVVIKYFLGK